MKDLIKRPLKNRAFFLRLGFVFALAFIILAFQWKPDYQPPKPGYGNTDDTPVMELIASNIKEKKEQQTKRTVKKKQPELKSDQIKVVEEKPAEKANEPKVKLDLSQMVDESIPGQGPVDDDFIEAPVHFAKQMPEFPGGKEAMFKYIYENINFPKLARDMKIEGTVHIRFVVDQFGNVIDVSILRGVHSLLDREAKKVISGMPRWKPGKQNSRPVAVIHTIPIKFEVH